MKQYLVSSKYPHPNPSPYHSYLLRARGQCVRFGRLRNRTIQSLVSSKRLVHWSVAFLAILTLIQCISSAHAALHDEQPFVITYQAGVSNQQLVTVYFDGNITGTFLLDTGTSTSQIFHELAVRMNLRPAIIKSKDGNARSEDPNDEDIEEGINFRFSENMRMIASFSFPKAEGYSVVSGRKIDGVIGSDILKDFAVLFDFQEHRISFWQGGKLSPAQLTQNGLGKAYSVPLFDFGGGDCCMLDVRFNGSVTERMMVDTGAAVTMLIGRRTQELHLISLGNVIAKSIYGSFKQHSANVNKFEIGDFSAGITPLLYSERKIGPLPPLLGLDFLTQHHLLIDYPAKRMYFAPVEHQSITIPFSKHTIYSMPFFDVQLADGKVHMLGLSTHAHSALDSSLIAHWPAQPDMLGPSRKAGIKILTSSMDLPIGKRLFDKTDFKLFDIHNTQKSVPLLDGIIGEDLLSQYAVRLNFSRKQMTFILPGNLAGTLYLPKNAIRIPLVLTDKGYALQMLVDSKHATFVLSLLHNDTTLNSKTLVRSLKPKAVETYVGKDTRERELRLHSISVGGKQWTEPIVDDESSSASDEPNWLGTDFLERYVATIDFAGQALYLETDPDYKPDLTENVSVGIRPTLASNGRIFVLELSDSSSAREANVQLGDEILAVNGKLVSKTTLDEISHEFKKPVGTVVTVLIQHKGDAAPRTVKLIVRKVL